MEIDVVGNVEPIMEIDVVGNDDVKLLNVVPWQSDFLFITVTTP